METARFPGYSKRPTEVTRLLQNALWSSNSNTTKVPRIVGDFNLVTWREESVESLNETGIALKECGDALDHARGVDPREKGQ